MAKPHSECREGNPNQLQIPLLAPQTSQFLSQADPYQLQNKNEIMTRINILEENCFNESLLTLLNGQQDVKKQSFNMMQDITSRHENTNLL